MIAEGEMALDNNGRVLRRPDFYTAGEYRNLQHQLRDQKESRDLWKRKFENVRESYYHVAMELQGLQNENAWLKSNWAPYRSITVRPRLRWLVNLIVRFEQW